MTGSFANDVRRNKNFVQLVSLCCIILFFSCQDKYLMGVIPSATGSLKSDSTGSCLSETISGVFIAGKEMNDTNYLQVGVNVKSTGKYTIKSTTVNGYSFSASGSFNTTGLNTVKLAATGKPVTAGANNFSVNFDTSVCKITIIVLPVGSAPAPAAVFTLSGTTSCLNDTLSGNYVKGITLDTSSKVVISLTVTVAGTYRISTDTVNGYKFSAVGTFTKTGAQTVILTASGTPVNSGTDAFTVIGTSADCTFPVTVVTGVAVTGTDHFPLTNGDLWNYDDLFSTGDTLQRIMTDSVNTNNNRYQIMEERQAGNNVQYLFRKVDSIYYEYGSVDKYTNSVKFSPQIKKEFPFLKEGLSTGDAWSTDEYIGPATFGQTIYLKYNFSCINANAVVTVNGKTFTNVYKIVMLPQIKSAQTYPYTGTGERMDIYYAKGIGIIYYKSISSGGSSSFTLAEKQIRNWVVK